TDTPANLRRQGVHNEQAILHGFNGEESGPFIIFGHATMKDYESKIRALFPDQADAILKLYPAETDEEADRCWAEIYGAAFFNYSHYCLNRLAAQQDIPVYEYLFTKQNGSLSDWHSGELIYAFGNLPDNAKLFDESDRTLSRIMHTYWVNFARTGNPNGEGVPEFPENPTSQKILRLDETIEVIDEPYLKLYQIFDGS
ncbi:MAG: carboxylesterase family protein, partial [Solobacterium sp.]|nr:carboxylesterase family protein [Solobacterium sp.]